MPITRRASTGSVRTKRRGSAMRTNRSGAATHTDRSDAAVRDHAEPDPGGGHAAPTPTRTRTVSLGAGQAPGRTDLSPITSTPGKTKRGNLTAIVPADFATASRQALDEVAARRAREPARRTEVVDALARLPGLADPGADPDFLSAADLPSYQALHATATAELQALAAERYVSDDGLDAALRQVKTVTTAAANLRERAAAARDESDRLRADVAEQGAGVPALLPLAGVDPVYLAPHEIAAFQTRHTAAAAELTAVAGAKRVDQSARDAAVQRLAELSTAVAQLRQRAEDNRKDSDRLREDVVSHGVEVVKTLLPPPGVDPTYLSTTEQAGYQNLHAAVTTELAALAVTPWVTQEARDVALARVSELTAAVKTLQDAAAAALKESDGFRAELKARFDELAVRRKAVPVAKLTLSERGQLNAAFDAATTLLADTGTAPGRVTATARTAALAEADKAVAAADAVDMLLQAAAVKKAQDDAAKLANYQANGRWSAKGEVIGVTTRQSVGRNEDERVRITEALDALKVPGKPWWGPKVWGDVHYNAEGNLPGVQGAGGYREYYVRPLSGNKDVLRLVVSDTTGFVYFTTNHYGSSNTNAPFARVTNA